MQDNIAGEIGKLVVARFGLASTRAVASRGTANEEAYWLYLQGKNLSARPSAADRKSAVEYFRQSILLDPNFARGYAGLVHGLMASCGNHCPERPQIQIDARQAINKALELDPDLADAYAALGELKLEFEWDFAGAERALLRAIELDPSSELGHSEYAYYLAAHGRFDEAISEMQLALEIDPKSCVNQLRYGRILYMSGRFDDAIVQFKRVIEVDDSFYNAYDEPWLTYEMKGDHVSAFEWFMIARKRPAAKIDPERIAKYQSAYETGGWLGLWQLDPFGSVMKAGPNSNFFALARDAIRFGDKERTLEFLNRAADRRQGQMLMIKYYPFFLPLHDDPRFYEIVKRVGLH
jgi:tetratricopeptide (TPR) repeat protein